MSNGKIENDAGLEQQVSISIMPLWPFDVVYSLIVYNYWRFSIGTDDFFRFCKKYRFALNQKKTEQIIIQCA